MLPGVRGRLYAKDHSFRLACPSSRQQLVATSAQRQPARLSPKRQRLTRSGRAKYGLPRKDSLVLDGSETNEVHVRPERPSPKEVITDVYFRHLPRLKPQPPLEAKGHQQEQYQQELELYQLMVRASCEAITRKVPNFGPKVLAVILQGLAGAGVAPQQFITLVCQQCYRRMWQFPSSCLARLLHSLGDLGSCPSPQWMKKYYRVGARSLGGVPLTGLAAMLRGMATLNLQPQESWMQMVCRKVKKKLQRSGKKQELGLPSVKSCRWIG